MSTTTATPVPPVRQPSRFATYPGDVRHIVGEIKGPNTLGEYLTAVTAEHDPATNTTRGGFAYPPPPDVTAALAANGLGVVR